MAGTTVYYNGVLFQDCETKEVQQLIEYDSETMSVEKYSRFKITIVSRLISIFKPSVQNNTPSFSAEHPSTIKFSLDGDGNNVHFGSSVELAPFLVDRVEEIMRRIQQPGMDFWIAINGTLNAPANAVPETTAGDPAENPYRMWIVATGEETGWESAGGAMLDTFVLAPDADGNLVNTSIARKDVVDCDHGPKPMDLIVQRILGGTSIEVQATFEVCRYIGPLKSEVEDNLFYDKQKTVAVISNRWSVSDSLDDRGVTTHNIEGKLTVKDHRFKANSMRAYCFPLLFPYSRLISRKYGVDASGLVLLYNFVIAHAGAAPPTGVRSFEAHYTESTLMGTPGIDRGEMTIKAIGWYHPKNFNERQGKAALLAGAYTILHSRIRGLTRNNPNNLPGQNPQRTLLQDMTVIEAPGKPEIQLNAKVMYTPEEAAGEVAFDGFMLRLKNMGVPFDIPNYDPRWWPIDTVWGRTLEDDRLNPYFRNALFPHGELGSPEYSSYFSGMASNGGGSLRHTLPRLADGIPAGAEDINFTSTPNDGALWAFPDGRVPAAVEESTETSENGSLPLPPLTAVQFRDVFGELNFVKHAIDGLIIDTTVVDNDALSENQKSGFAYLQWDSDILTDSLTGVKMVPLSKARTVPIPGSASSTMKMIQTAVPIRLHAGVSKRVYSVIASRVGAWPNVPPPLQMVLRGTGSEGGSGSGIDNVNYKAMVETLLSNEIISQNPILFPDKRTKLYTIHYRLTYGLSRKFDSDSADYLPVDTSPILKTADDQKKIPLQPAEGETL